MAFFNDKIELSFVATPISALFTVIFLFLLLDFSPIEIPLSPQLLRSRLTSSYFPAEKSVQSLIAEEIFKLFIFNSEKSASRASLNEF